MTPGPWSSTPYTDWPDEPTPQFPLSENGEQFPTHGLEGWFRRINSCKRFRAWYIVRAQSVLNYHCCCCWLPYKVLFTITSCHLQDTVSHSWWFGLSSLTPTHHALFSAAWACLSSCSQVPLVSPANQAFKRILEAVTSVKSSLTTPVLSDLPASVPQPTYVTSFPHHMTHLKGPWPCRGWRQITDHPRACAQCSAKPCPIPTLIHSCHP